MPRARVEDQIQAAIVTHLRTVLPNAIVLHVHNTPRNAIDGARLRKMGMVAGAPDLLVCLEGGKGLFLEVKAPKGRVEPEQHAFANQCLVVNWPWAVVRSIDDVRLALAALRIKTREVAA